MSSECVCVCWPAARDTVNSSETPAALLWWQQMEHTHTQSGCCTIIYSHSRFEFVRSAVDVIFSCPFQVLRSLLKWTLWNVFDHRSHGQSHHTERARVLISNKSTKERKWKSSSMSDNKQLSSILFYAITGLDWCPTHIIRVNINKKFPAFCYEIIWRQNVYYL